MLPAIDWQQPWFAPYRDLGRAVASRIAVGAGVAHALNAQCSLGAPQFVAPQTQGAEAYETFVARTSCVPTRDNLHDFFNGLVWLRFTALKRRLNLLHAAEIDRDGVTPARGAARDRLTLFDENGALFAAPDALMRALQRRDWYDLFVAQRGHWQGAQLFLVGHALLEKLAQPRKAITAHVWLGDAEPGCNFPDPTGAPFAPLPVLGVPGWWPANEAPGFYSDAAVFRPAGNLRSTSSARPCRS